MEREWSLARYREFNDRLARRVGEMEKKEPMTAIGQELDHDLSELERRELERRQAAKLFVSRLHRVAAKLTTTDPESIIVFANLRLELYELADEIEERLSR